MSNTFILSWDQLGLESVVCVDDIEKEEMWQILSASNNQNNQTGRRTRKIDHIISSLMLRAKFNAQRHYEIYSVNVVDGISEEDIRDMFKNNPQGSAELIRELGQLIYSDRQQPSQIKIT